MDKEGIQINLSHAQMMELQASFERMWGTGTSGVRAGGGGGCGSLIVCGCSGAERVNAATNTIAKK